MPERRGPRRSDHGGTNRYPRTARVNQVLHEVVADELERLVEDDPRLGILTVTGFHVDPDLRHATVYVGTLNEAAAEALAEHRIRLQAAIARQVRLKRTPQLRFAADPAVATGARIEDIIRDLGDPDEGSAG